MNSKTSSRASTERKHPYQGLENADTNYATILPFYELGETETFLSDTDWRKTQKKAFYRLLSLHHQGRYNNKRENKQYGTYQMNRAASKAVADTLELTSKETHLAEKWFKRLDFRKLGGSFQLSAFCIGTWLIRVDEYDERDFHPNTPIEKWPDAIRNMYESLEDEYQRQMVGAWERIRYKIENWDHSTSTPSRKMDKYDMDEAKMALGT